MQISDGANTIDVSVIELHSYLLELELKHKIAKGKFLEPTAEFLSAIAGHVHRLGLRISLSGAWQLWRGVCMHVERVRKRHAIAADLAHWFGVNPFALTDEQRVALYGNLHRVQAQAILNSGNYSPTDYENVYELTLLATGSQEQALAARLIAMKRFVDSQIAKEKQPNG